MRDMEEDSGRARCAETQSPTHPSLAAGYLMVLAAAIFWSFGGFFVKILTGPEYFGVAPRALGCLRALIAGLVLSWALPGIRGIPRWKLLGSGVCYTIVVGGFVLATAGTTAANAILLQYAYPLFVAVGAVFLFAEPLGRRTVLALVIGMTGIAIILICSWTPTERTGVAIGFATAFAFAAFTLFQRSMRDGCSIGLSSFYNLMGAALLFPFAYGALRVSLPTLLVVAVMATFQLGIPYVLFIRGLRTVPATDAALITLVEPVLNPVWVWLTVGESPHPSTIVGGALILVALLTRFLGLRRRQSSEPRPPSG